MLLCSGIGIMSHILTENQVRNNLKVALKHLNPPPSNFIFHTLRRSGSIFAFNYNVPLQAIKQHQKAVIVFGGDMWLIASCSCWVPSDPYFLGTQLLMLYVYKAFTWSDDRTPVNCVIMYEPGLVFTNIGKLSLVIGLKVVITLYKTFVLPKFCLKFVFTKGDFAKTGLHSAAQLALG